MWLKYEWSGRYHAAKLLCTVCKQVKSSRLKEFQPHFLEGSTNLRTLSVRDHARSDMHQKAMPLSRRVFFYATDQSPIVKALSRMDISAKEIIICF